MGAPMDDYYAPHALLSLRRPLAVAGYVAADTRAVVYRVASLTGLPFADVDRKVEHRAGRSLWQLAADAGVAAYRRLEAEAVRHELRSSPPGLVALGDGTLLDPELRREILDAVDLVALEMDLATCFWRLHVRQEESTGWHPFHPEPLSSLEQVRPYYERRRPGLDAAPHQVALDGQDLTVTSDRLNALIDRLAT